MGAVLLRLLVVREQVCRAVRGRTGERGGLPHGRARSDLICLCACCENHRCQGRFDWSHLVCVRASVLFVRPCSDRSSTPQSPQLKVTSARASMVLPLVCAGCSPCLHWRLIVFVFVEGIRCSARMPALHTPHRSSSIAHSNTC